MKRIKLPPFDNSNRYLFIEMSMCSQILKYLVESCLYNEAKAAVQMKGYTGEALKLVKDYVFNE